MDSISNKLKASSLDPPAAVRPMPASLPTTLTRSYTVNGVPTDAWVQLFSDRVVFGLSQRDTHVGTFLSCEVEESVLDLTSKPRFNVTALLGGQRLEDQILHVLCRRLTEDIASLRTKGDGITCPPVLLAISLQSKGELDPNVFRELVQLLVSLYKDAIRVASS